MAIRIEVRNQAEFDACIKAGNIAVVINCSVVARENSSVEAWGNSSVVARENSSVEAWGNSSVEAWGNSSVVAWENSSVVAWGNSSVVAWGNSSVVAWENSSVVAWGNSSVVARENSSVVAWGLAFIRWFSCLKIKASLQVIIAKIGDAPGTQEGGRILQCNLPTTPAEWCEFYGIEVADGIAILYKAVDDDYSTHNARPKSIFYTPGNTPSAPDWDGGLAECGGGLHFSPSTQMALSFNSSAKKFVGCPVRVEDIVVHPKGQYPEKVKAKGCTAPVFEVNRKGERL